MGLGIQIDAPAFVQHPHSVALYGPAAWIADEFAFDTAPRFLMSTFVPDQPGLLQRLLAAVDDGITLPPRPTEDSLTESERRVRFSIDGSLASSLRGAFTAALVLKALVSASAKQMYPDIDDLVPTALRDHVAEHLDGIGLPENIIQNIDVHPFVQADSRLFRGRRFAEYRFGVSRAGATPQRQLAEMTLRFARELGTRDVPIAYLHFPDTDTEDPDGLDWVRLGVGSPPRAVESMEIDLIANDLAADYQCRYRKYDPMRGGGSMDDRFTLIADYVPDTSSQVARSSTTSSGPAIAGPVDVIFAQGRARVGLVGQMLSGESGPDLIAGSMTVLAGHTVSSWVVQAGQGASFASEVVALDAAADIDSAQGIFMLGPLEIVTQAESAPAAHHWVAWRCDDTPGVTRHIVDAINAFFQAGPHVTPDLRYSISRVLEQGEVCAGKLRFSIPTEVAFEPETLRQEVLLALQAHVPESNCELRVLAEEPGEEPWASLLLL